MHFFEWIWMNFVWNVTVDCPKGPVNNIPALGQIMAGRRPGDKPLSEAMMAKFTHPYMRHSASLSKQLSTSLSFVQMNVMIIFSNLNTEFDYTKRDVRDIAHYICCHMECGRRSFWWSCLRHNGTEPYIQRIWIKWIIWIIHRPYPKADYYHIFH